jgi:hypothetical protein
VSAERVGSRLYETKMTALICVVCPRALSRISSNPAIDCEEPTSRINVGNGVPKTGCMRINAAVIAFAPVCGRCFGLHARSGCFFLPGNQQSKTLKSDIWGEDCTGVSVSNPRRLRAPLSQIRHAKLSREQNLDNVDYLMVWFRRIICKCYFPGVLIKNNGIS